MKHTNSLRIAIVVGALSVSLATPAMAGQPPSPPEGCTDGYVMANGIRIHYWRTGGDKPVLLVAHGSSDDGLCWTNLAKELEADYDIIMPDARGHGLSDPPSKTDSADAQAGASGWALNDETQGVTPETKTAGRVRLEGRIREE